jgi:hypothetical protein
MGYGLFDTPSAKAGVLMQRVKTEMARCVSESGLSRDQVLDRINEIAATAGIRIGGGNSTSLGRATLDKWLNPAEHKHLPGLIALNIFCLALKDPGPLVVQMETHGWSVMSEQDRKYRDYGKACMDEKEARRRKRMMEAAI